jgi:hypothetical protein
MQPRVSGAIAIALVIALAFVVHALGARAATPEVESPTSSVQAEASPSDQPSESTSAGIADLLSLAFIGLLWALSNKVARHHRSIRPRRHARSAVVSTR